MISFARHQFPPAIIRHSLWLYFRFTLGFRDVEDLLAERGSADLAGPLTAISAPRRKGWRKRRSRSENKGTLLKPEIQTAQEHKLSIT
jgi:hypothetical protein